jgi:thiol:disulfide interchange protein
MPTNIKGVLVLANLVLATAVICAEPPSGTASKPTPSPSTQPASKPAAVQWLTSYAEAAQQAAASGRPILTNFTGTDWCKWCKTLKDEVFDTQEFADWSAKNVILLELDYPKDKQQDEATKKQNQELLKKYKVKTFPAVVFLKADGTSVGQTGYIKGGPTAWTAKAQEILNAAPNSGK